MPTKITDVLARRNDLSSFLVHLTKPTEDQDAKSKLISIIQDGYIRAQTNLGFAKTYANRGNIDRYPQQVVCLTETPLEHIHFLVEDIEGRSAHFDRYGIIITKKWAREHNVNPVWYVENVSVIREALQRLFTSAMHEDSNFRGDFFQITPFIETMGCIQGRNHEFWWEREWRKVGNLELPQQYIVICPENEAMEFLSLAQDTTIDNMELSYIDPSWGMEQIIASLAGFDLGRDINIL